MIFPLGAKECLLQSRSTRWGSAYFMCEKLVKNRIVIQTVFNDRNVTRAKTTKQLETCEEDWEVMSILMTILKPTRVVTVVLCSDSVPQVFQGFLGN